jgi:hypothetical protein
LLGAAAADATGVDQPARTAWHPLGLLALSAGSDSLASLTFGFGTALRASPEDLFMVTVRHLSIGGQDFEFELADVVAATPSVDPPDAPANLSATLRSHDRPLALDGPRGDSVAVTWDRPPNPAFWHCRPWRPTRSATPSGASGRGRRTPRSCSPIAPTL